ncbi:MAG: hypothetical protein JWQ18_3074 [Conexibacter sp.]|nr:hypothetical protein [Conexibacter sp.]
MSEQLSLLGDAAAEKTVRVAPSPRVLVYGANAPEVPCHRDAGALGTATAKTVRLMLGLTEDALRYNQAPDPRLVVPEKRGRGIGSNGPMGRNSLMADGTGIRDFRTDECATWPQLLRALAAQRKDEPHVARARDLAEAYHYLSYYSRAYGTPHDAPPQLLEDLRVAIGELGGDPDSVEI